MPILPILPSLAKAELTKLALTLTGDVCWPENFPEIDVLMQGLRYILRQCQIVGRCTGRSLYDCPCEV